MAERSEYSEIVSEQCERTAREYYAFRKRGGTANDLVEIPAMKSLIGDVRGKRLIDCGCGFGFYSIYCAQQGAIVTGVDISETMIELAKAEAAKAGVEVEFRVENVANMKAIPSNTFDMALCSVVVCFGMPQLFKEIARVLKKSGTLCFSEVHPMLDKESYLERGIRKAKNVFGKLNPTDPDYEWRWEHCTLEDYFRALREAGLMLETFLEPKPDPATRDLNPDRYERASKRPSFFLIRAIKTEGRGK